MLIIDSKWLKHWKMHSFTS